MLIEAGTLDNEQDLEIPILRVDGQQITIPNFLGWLPTETTIPAGTEINVDLFPDQESIVQLHGYPTPPRTGRVQITVPEGFLGIDTELVLDGSNNLITQDGLTYIFTDFRNAMVAGQGADLIAASPNALTLRSGPGLEFQTFSTKDNVYLNLPLNTADPRISSTGGVTANDISSVSVLKLPASTVGVSNFGDTTAAPAPAEIQLYTLPSRQLPEITNGTERVAATPPGTTSRWICINKQSLPEGTPFKNWGIVESFERKAVNIAPSNNFRLFTSAVGTSEYDRIWDLAVPQVDQKDPQLATGGDWVDIPQGAFSSVFASTVHRLFGKDQVFGRTFETSSSHMTGPISSFSTSSVGNLVNHKMYEFIVSQTLYNNSQARLEFHGYNWGDQFKINIIRPFGRVAFANDATIQIKPGNSYKLQSDLKFRYLDDQISINRPMKIGRYRGEKRLTRDLYVYNTAKDIISSDTFTIPSTESFSFTADRVGSFLLQTLPDGKVLSIRVNILLSPAEQQYLRNGNLGNGTFDIPADVTLLGMSDISLEYAGIANDAIFVRIPPDLVSTVEAAIAAHTRGSPLFNKPINFVRASEPEPPALIIKSITEVSAEERINLEFERITHEETLETLNDVLDTAQQIFIPRGSSFLGIEGIQIFDIVDIDKQTDDRNTIIAVSTIGYASTSLARTQAPFATGRFVIGNFSIGGPGVISDIDDTTAAALRQNGQYSYKLLWSYTDANGNKIIGAPSESLYVTRKEAQRPVDLDLIITVPDEILNSININDYTFEVFRSSKSANASTIPRQDEGLIHTGTVEYDEETREPFKRMVIIDRNPELARGRTLYTSPLQEGVENTNSRPPIAEDLAPYKEHLFYANTIHPSSQIITLKGTGPTSLQPTEDVRSKGPERGEWIAINPRNISDVEAESDTVFFFASNRFEGRDIVDEGKPSGDPRTTKNFFRISDNESVALSIAETARSLVRVINLHEELGIEAIYVSSENDFPGRIALRHKSPSTEPFTIRSNAGFVASNPNVDDTWAPSLRRPTSSDLNIKQNALFFSKYREPEAVPLLNFIEIGSKDEPILRIIPLRESLFVFKPDGVYRITGDNPRNLTVEPFDLTITLLAPESAVAISNNIYCLTNQGIVSINDNGLKIESRPIENIIQKILLSPHVDKCFAVAYESDRKYILNLPNADGSIEEQYVLNIITQGWTRWTIAALSGTILNDKLILADIGRIKEERKTGTQSDYQDEVDQPINTNIEWTTIHADAPDKTKQFAEARVFFSEAPRNRENLVQLGFNTEKSTIPEFVPLYIPPHHTTIGFGLGAYGVQPYGSPITKEEAISRTYVPRNKQKAALMHLRLTHTSLKDSMSLTGVSVSMRDISTRTDK